MLVSYYVLHIHALDENRPDEDVDIRLWYLIQSELNAGGRSKLIWLGSFV